MSDTHEAVAWLAGQVNFGFTGTRYGCNLLQRAALGHLCWSLPEGSTFHHGGCVGADAEFHEFVSRIRYHHTVVHPGHPYGSPLETDMVASLSGVYETRSALPFLQRNRVIVDETRALIAVSASAADNTSGGTWYTIGRARKAGRRIAILWPDGSWGLE